MNFNELHPEAWARLNQLRSRLPHALLISGQRGIGKFELAQDFAKSLLCENPGVNHTACGKCLPCGWFSQKNHPDFRLVQPEAEGDEIPPEEKDGKKTKPSVRIKIEQVRALDEFLHVGTHRHGSRIILIHPAEAMNPAAANSLLKALEEPIADTLFLLVSNEFSRLLPTIRSRCQLFPISRPDAQQAETWLRNQAGIPQNAENWLALAGGSPLLAVALAEEEHVLLDEFLAELSKGMKFDPLAAAVALERIVKAEKRSAPLKRIVEWMQKWLFDLLLTCEGLPQRYFLAQTKVLRELSARVPCADILAFNRKSLQYRMHCEQPLNSRLFLEDFFLNYAAVFNYRGDHV